MQASFAVTLIIMEVLTDQERILLQTVADIIVI